MLPPLPVPAAPGTLLSPLPATTAVAATAAAATTTAYGCPRTAAFSDPWVRDNVVLTYAHQLQDGLGGQATRLMGIYATAAALGLRYLHTTLQCVGHIGERTHWRNASCDHLTGDDARMLRRARELVELPSSSPPGASSWRPITLRAPSWEDLAAAAADAAARRAPTLLRVEMVNKLLTDCPDLFRHVPEWRPPGSAGGITTTGLLGHARGVRVAVHMRRGDLTAGPSGVRRGLPTGYYERVVAQVVAELEAAGAGYTVEWFTEPPTSPEEAADLARLRRSVPAITLLTDSDVLWNWGQLATADVLVMSKSAYSLVPALLNTQGLVLRPPLSTPCTRHDGCTPSGWHLAADTSGTLAPLTLTELRRRLQGRARNSGSAELPATL